MESKAFPSLSGQGAYHPRLVYSQEDLRDIVSHATERGIRVVPEFVSHHDPRLSAVALSVPGTSPRRLLSMWLSVAVFECIG